MNFFRRYENGDNREEVSVWRKIALGTLIVGSVAVAISLLDYYGIINTAIDRLATIIALSIFATGAMFSLFIIYITKAFTLSNPTPAARRGTRTYRGLRSGATLHSLDLQMEASEELTQNDDVDAIDEDKNK